VSITIHCVRHAQGYHNLNTANHSILDPLLTPLGERQCSNLSAEFPHHSKITHLVASPLRRTLYTTLLSFPSLVLTQNLKVTALPELQETSNLPCDTGSAPSVLISEFASGKWAGCVDFSLLEDNWTDKSLSSPYAPTKKALENRARTVRRWLRELGRGGPDEGQDAEIVVVTHGGLLHFLTEDWGGFVGSAGTGWANAEYRSYRFKNGDGDEQESWEETEESRKRRSGHEIPLTEDEQREWAAVSHLLAPKLSFRGRFESRDQNFQAGRVLPR
jgi:broad specificity phosphatase PhoE